MNVLIELSAPVVAHLHEDVRSKLLRADEAIVSVAFVTQGVTLSLPDGSDEAIEARATTRAQRVLDSVLGVSRLLPKKQRVQVLEDRMDRATPCTTDPFDELVRRGELSIEASGIAVLGPLLSGLIDAFDARIVALARSAGAKAYRVPALIPAAHLAQLDYFRSFPHHLTFASHLGADLDAMEDFARDAHIEGDAIVPPPVFAPTRALLSPAACYQVYRHLASRPLDPAGSVSTTVGQCFRYEGRAMTTLERLWNFSMREVIFVGAPDFVREGRDRMRERVVEVLDRDLALGYRIETANDPFFIGDARKQALFQNIHQLKFEIRARLPFSDTTLAVGSFNYHFDFFGSRIGIAQSDGSAAHTACVAFGLERMAYAFVCQYGLDPARWPAAMQAAVA